MEFRSRIDRTASGRDGIEVPDLVLAALGADEEDVVLLDIDGWTVRTSVRRADDGYIAPLDAIDRAMVGAAVGDEVAVSVRLDAEED